MATGRKRKSAHGKKQKLYRGKPRRHDTRLAPGAKHDPWKHKAQGK